MKKIKNIFLLFIILFAKELYADSNVIMNKKSDRINKRKEFISTDFYQDFKDDLESIFYGKLEIIGKIEYMYMEEIG